MLETRSFVDRIYQSRDSLIHEFLYEAKSSGHTRFSSSCFELIISSCSFDSAPLELTSGHNLTRLIYLSYAYSLDSYGAPNFTEKSITHIDIP